ncbi:unnamed protein product [Musa textilis]
MLDKALLLTKLCWPSESMFTIISIFLVKFKPDIFVTNFCLIIVTRRPLYIYTLFLVSFQVGIPIFSFPFFFTSSDNLALGLLSKPGAILQPREEGQDAGDGDVKCGAWWCKEI